MKKICAFIILLAICCIIIAKSDKFIEINLLNKTPVAHVVELPEIIMDEVPMRCVSVNNKNEEFLCVHLITEGQFALVVVEEHPDLTYNIYAAEINAKGIITRTPLVLDAPKGKIEIKSFKKGDSKV